jgi:hypothetical protein
LLGSFGGYDFDANRVLVVDPVERHRTGNLNDGLRYGVTVRLEGTSITILNALRPSEWPNHRPTPEECREAAEKMREELLDCIWPGRTPSTPTASAPEVPEVGA